MSDPEDGPGEPLPTLFYGLLPKPRHADPTPDAEWRAEARDSGDAERDRQPRLV